MSRKQGNNAFEADSAQFGGLDLIQFVVALLIIGIAAASSTFSVFIGRGALDHEWRKKRAMEIARNEMEYWSAIIYEGQIELAGQTNPLPIRLTNKTIEREEVLDPRDPESSRDDILCQVIREPLKKNQILYNQNQLLSYKIELAVVWMEPTNMNKNRMDARPDTVKLKSWMIYKESL